jgi:heme-degrading monooxygenase HmoA
VWVSQDDPDRVTLVIRWASLAQWKSFPAALLAELDARMDGLQVSLTCETYEEVP